jgi:hypothetical protein
MSMTDSTNDPINETDDILAGALGRLPREKAPPRALEEATVAKLRTAGFLKSAPQARAPGSLSLATWVLAASIAAIAFVGSSVYRSSQPQPSDPLFALTVYTAESTEDSATKVSQADELDRWALSVNAAQGPSSARSAVDINSDSIIVEEEPYRNKQIVRTYYITAPSKDSAASIAKNCPSIKHGGRVVVQAVLDKVP